MGAHSRLNDPTSGPVTDPQKHSTHVLGIDDGPLDRFTDTDTLVVGVVMAGAKLVEGVLTTRLAIDGADATTRLAEWVNGSRFRPLLRAILLDGITIAGLSVVDLPKLSDRTGLPVIAVTRKEPDPKDLSMALESAGFFERLESVRRAGQSGRFRDVSFSCAGIADSEVDRLLANQVGKSKMPECLRLAHLIAGGVTRGESRGR